MSSSNIALPTEPPLHERVIGEVLADGLTYHYARRLVEARSTGDAAATTRVMDAIWANHPDPAAVGTLAVRLTIQQP